MLNEVPDDVFDVQVTVNKAQLQGVLNALTTKVNLHDQIIESLVKDLKGKQHNIEILRTSVQESVVNMKRQLQAHDAQLRLAQQTADVSVSTTQFNSALFNMRDELSKLTGRLGIVEESASKSVLSNMHRHVKEFVGDWYQETCLKESAEREELLEQKIHQDLERGSVGDLRAALISCASEEKVQLLLDSLRNDVIRNRKHCTEESERLGKQVVGNEKSVERQFISMVNKNEVKFKDQAQRIGTMFDLMSISETEALDVTGRESKAASPTAGMHHPQQQRSVMRMSLSGSMNAQTMQQQLPSPSQPSPRGQHLHPTRTAVADNTTSGRQTPVDTPSASSSATVPKTVGVASDAGGSSAMVGGATSGGTLARSNSNVVPTFRQAAVAGGGAGPTHVDGDIDEKTALLMHSPVFLSFRHQILRDIGDRLSSSRQNQSSDFDLELLDIRNELRQRVTPQRVVELIRQSQDTETPHKISSLNRRVQEMEVDKVSHDFLNEALRAKGDLHVVQLKADRTMLREVEDSFKSQLNTLRQQFDSFVRDRNEFQILKEVLKAQQLAHMQPSLQSTEGMSAQQLAEMQQQIKGGSEFNAIAVGGGAFLPAGSNNGGGMGGGPNASMNPDMVKEMNRLVVEEQGAAEVRRKLAESLPSIRTPSKPLTSTTEYSLPKSPEPTYMASSQGVDGRSREAVVMVDDSKKPKPGVARDHIQEALKTAQPVGTPEPPVRRDASSRQGKRAPSVRPLTDHRQRDREMNAMLSGGTNLPNIPNAKSPSSVNSATPDGPYGQQQGSTIREGAGSPVSMIPAKASIPQASTLRSGAGPPMVTTAGGGSTSSPRKTRGSAAAPGGGSNTARLPSSYESVVPLTTSQVAYAQFVAEATLINETEQQSVVPYKDLKTREHTVQHNL